MLVIIGDCMSGWYWFARRVGSAIPTIIHAVQKFAVISYVETCLRLDRDSGGKLEWLLAIGNVA